MEKQAAAKVAREEQPKGVGERGPVVLVPYPQGVLKGEVVGTLKGRRQKSVLFGAGETPYKVAAHLCYATEAPATVRWQKAKGVGEQHSKPTPNTHTRRPARPQPPNRQRPPRQPAIGSAPAEAATRSVPAEPTTGSAEDRAWDTQTLWESPSCGEL